MDIRKSFLTEMAVRPNGTPRQVIESLSLEVFVERLDICHGVVDRVFGQKLDSQISGVFSKLIDSMIPQFRREGSVLFNSPRNEKHSLS